MHDPTALPSPAVARTSRPIARRRPRLPLALLLVLVGAVAGAAFVALIEAPLPEEIVLASLERALGPDPVRAR